jgi:hypothetical protein
MKYSLLSVSVDPTTSALTIDQDDVATQPEVITQLAAANTRPGQVLFFAYDNDLHNWYIQQTY